MSSQTELMFNAEEFARRVRVCIADRGFKQIDCADETGISKATISRIGNGKTPDVETYLRLTAWMASDIRIGAP